MCYSAMVEQSAKSLGLRFKARVQTDLYDDLFTQRLAGHKISLSSAIEMDFAGNPRTLEERAIATKIKRWHETEAQSLAKKIDEQKLRLESAVEKSKVKVTKTLENEIRVAKNWIEKYSDKMNLHKDWSKERKSTQRIFPFHFMSMLYLNEKGEKAIGPFRYHMRPHNESEKFDKTHNGCYNARYDNLKRVPFWRDSLGKRHGLILVAKFYENVSAKDYMKKNKLPQGRLPPENMVICFEPKGVEFMFIPTLWDRWGKGPNQFLSAALITDEPPPEVSAAGHDRCPIFLREAVIDDWLGASEKNALDILKERETPFYEHSVVEVA